MSFSEGKGKGEDKQFVQTCTKRTFHRWMPALHVGRRSPGSHHIQAKSRTRHVFVLDGADAAVHRLARWITDASIDDMDEAVVPKFWHVVVEQWLPIQLASFVLEHGKMTSSSTVTIKWRFKLYMLVFINRDCFKNRHDINRQLSP